MQRVRERLADPKLDIDAQTRSDEITRRIKAMHVNELAIALQNEKRPGKKFIWLRKLGDVLGKAAEGVAPCGEGCSHCCNMATMISSHEARAIAKATGRKMTVPVREILTRADVEIEREQFDGVPCTMLKDGRCSIYEHRPWSCRVHYVMDRDNLLCKIIPGEKIIAPHYNTQKFNMLYVLAHDYKSESEVEMADIRDFFPEGA